MARLVSYNPADLPGPVAPAPKYDPEFIAAYVASMQKGQAAGDGQKYGSQKEARNAGASIKRAVRKSSNGTLSVRNRVWQADGKWLFALQLNEPAKAE